MVRRINAIAAIVSREKQHPIELSEIHDTFLLRLTGADVFSRQNSRDKLLVADVSGMPDMNTTTAGDQVGVALSAAASRRRPQVGGQPRS